jgi:translation initiation factor IF-2
MPTIAPGPIELPRALSVKDLADTLGVSAVDVIKELMKNGVMAAINQTIDYDTAAIVATDLGFEAVEQQAEPEAATSSPDGVVGRRTFTEDDPATLRPRPPIVTVMGHVDHGKTSLLDAIRSTKVSEREAGGITQHIGAYQVEVPDPDSGEPRTITFLDTPGHEAFTSMRARGAQATDIAILVVAADDGVMPTTREAIAHAKAAGVEIVVAINKIDLAGANPDRVKQELAQNDVLIEEYGGTVPAVLVSARTKQGLDDLLTTLLLVADVMDLRANPDRPAEGVVIEAEMDRNRGPLATILVQTGTLHTGDSVIVGDMYGRIKAMFDDTGRRLKSAGPAQPARVLGLSGVPSAGDILTIVRDEKTARTAVEARLRERQAERAAQRTSISLDTIFGEITAGKLKELNIILKTDVQGSIDPIRSSLERLSNEQVRVKLIHSATGGITESDANLAVASKAIIIGFNVRPDAGARRIADQEGVDIRYYDVIYNLVEDVERALSGMLEPVYVEVIDGHAEVRQIIRITRIGNIAGSYVTDGRVTRNDQVRVHRGGEQIFDGRVAALKRFKEDVREVESGYECGITLEGFDRFELGDTLEFYHRERQS